MKKGYFAVWFDGETFETTALCTSIVSVRKVGWFDAPKVQGHVVIFKSNGNSFFPIEEAWAPITPKLNWRKFQGAK